MRNIKLVINGEKHELCLEVHKTLLEVLREDLGLTGAKYGCGTGECGACTVLIGGMAVLSCLTLAVSVDGKAITTIEGLAEKGDNHPLQESFINLGAIQCGFCTSGIILSAKALLDESPAPTEEDVRQYLRGNLCRCTGYSKIVEAVLAAREKSGSRG